MIFLVQICISVIQIRTSVKKFSGYIIQIKIRVESIQIRHRPRQRLNWMTVLRTCCIFRGIERRKFRFEWRPCKFECWENKIEWRTGCAWPKSYKLNAHKMNLVDKITKLTGNTYTFLGKNCNFLRIPIFVDMVLHNWFVWWFQDNFSSITTPRNLVLDTWLMASLL